MKAAKRNTKFKMREMLKTDISDVVDIHMTAFEGFFLQRLGRKFISEYYRFVLDYNGSIALVCLNESHSVSGFVVGFEDPANFYKQLRASMFRFFYPIMTGFFKTLSCLSKSCLTQFVFRALIRLVLGKIFLVDARWSYHR